MEENYQVKAFDMILEDKTYKYTTIYVESKYYSLEFHNLTQSGWIPHGSPVITSSDKVIQNMKRLVKTK